MCRSSQSCFGVDGYFLEHVRLVDWCNSSLRSSSCTFLRIRDEMGVNIFFLDVEAWLCLTPSWYLYTGVATMFGWLPPPKHSLVYLIRQDSMIRSVIKNVSKKAGVITWLLTSSLVTHLFHSKIQAVRHQKAEFPLMGAWVCTCKRAWSLWWLHCCSCESRAAAENTPGRPRRCHLLELFCQLIHRVRLPNTSVWLKHIWHNSAL